MVCALTGAMFAGSLTASSAMFDKTRFLLHLGVAYFAFHHFVLQPYQQGAFASGAPHRISNVIKAGIATLFAYHEVLVAQKIAATSDDPLLKKLNGGLTALTTQLSTIGAKLKGGHFDPADVTALQSATNTVSSQAAAENLPITDKAVPIPGT